VGGKLVAVGDGRQLVLLRTDTGAEAFRLDGHTVEVGGAVFSADGKGLVSYAGEAGGAGEVLAWPPATENAPVRPERLLGTGAIAVALHPTRPVAVVAQGRRVVFLDASSLAVVDRQLEGDPVESLAFHPDGGLLAVGRAGGRISLWGLVSDRRYTPLWGHREGVCSLAFSADGSRLVSAAADGTVRLWDVSGVTP
jgi:hypothetical protein